jgi:hypothetical protein
MWTCHVLQGIVRDTNICKKEWHVATKPLKIFTKRWKLLFKSELLFLEKTTVPEWLYSFITQDSLSLNYLLLNDKQTCHFQLLPSQVFVSNLHTGSSAGQSLFSMHSAHANKLFIKLFFKNIIKFTLCPFQDKVFTYNVQGQLALSRKTQTVYSLLISP